MTRFVSGLDLGTAADFTALAVLEVDRVPESPPPEGHVGMWVAPMVNRYGVRHLQRWALGTAYTTIAEEVAALFDQPPLRGSALAADATGCGRPVIDMLRRSKIRAELTPIVITAGQTASTAKGFTNVPKKDLAAALMVSMQSRRFRVAPLPDRDVLVRELQNFRIKITVAGSESFEAWRERDHDDLVLSVMMAVWVAERRSTGGMAGRPVGTAPGLMMHNPFGPR